VGLALIEKHHKPLRSVLYNYLGRFGAQLIGLLVAIYVIRRLPVEDFGRYSVLVSMLMYVSVLTSLGMNNVLQRYIPELSTHKQFREINRLVCLAVIGRLILSTIAVGVLMVLSEPLGNFLNISNLLMALQVYGPAMVLTVVGDMLDVVLTSMLQQKAANSAMFLTVLFRGLGFYYVLNHDLGLYGLLLVELIAAGIRVTILAWSYLARALWASKHVQAVATRHLDRKRILRYGSWAYLNDLGGIFFNQYTDNFIISNYLGQASVAGYAFANRTVAMVSSWSPVTVASNVITPLFFERYTETGDSGELDHMFGMLNKMAYAFSLPILAGTLGLGDRFVSVLFGEKYVPFTWLFIGVLVYTVLNQYQYPLGLVVFAVERNQINFFSRIFSLYNLIAGIVLVRYWGLAGVLLATASAVSCKNLLIYIWIRREVVLSWNWPVLGKLLFNSFFVGLLAWIGRRWVTDIISLVLTVLVCGIAYAILTLVTGVLSDDEIKLINRTAGRHILPISAWWSPMADDSD